VFASCGISLREELWKRFVEKRGPTFSQQKIYYSSWRTLFQDSYKLESVDCYYHSLGISKTATRVEVQRAYKRKAMQVHPSKYTLNSSASEDLFKKCSEAYEVLSDETKRDRYDSIGFIQYRRKLKDEPPLNMEFLQFFFWSAKFKK